MYTVFEQRLFRRLNTPGKLQDFLDALPMNFEHRRESYYSPRRVLTYNKAHCMEAALFAAAVLQFHGHKPLLLDLRVIKRRGDFDHVVALFKVNKYWGAISKTNHATLRFRDPIYRTVRELAMSYFHEYYDDTGRKNLRDYAGPIDLSQFNKRKWQIAEEDLDYIPEFLNSLPHTHLVPKGVLLRKATMVERACNTLHEWKLQKGRSVKLY
jgi:hypothetical protein